MIATPANAHLTGDNMKVPALDVSYNIVLPVLLEKMARKYVQIARVMLCWRMDNAMFVIFWDVILVAQQESVDYVLMLRKLPLLKGNAFVIMPMNSPTARACAGIASIQDV